MGKIICPLCSVYLDGCGRTSQFENDYLMLRTLTPGYSHSSTKIKNYVVEETNAPHRLWGLEGSQYCFKVPDNQMNYEISKDNLYSKTGGDLVMKLDMPTNHNLKEEQIGKNDDINREIVFYFISILCIRCNFRLAL